MFLLNLFKWYLFFDQLDYSKFRKYSLQKLDFVEKKNFEFILTDTLNFKISGFFQFTLLIVIDRPEGKRHVRTFSLWINISKKRNKFSNFIKNNNQQVWKAYIILTIIIS